MECCCYGSAQASAVLAGLRQASPYPFPENLSLELRKNSQQHDFLINMRALTDFFFVAYDGTLAQWKDYLKNTALLPAALKDIRIDIDYGHRFSYTSKRLRFTFTPELQKVEPDSELTLGFSYFVDHGKVVWDVADVWTAANAHERYWVNVARSRPCPPASAP